MDSYKFAYKSARKFCQDPPGPIIPIDHLEQTHPAAVYLRAQGFDLRELAVQFGVGFCQTPNDERLWRAGGRIYIPMRGMADYLNGWKCRHVGDVDWEASGIREYCDSPGYPGFSSDMYNLVEARRYQPIILVPQPTDVRRIGLDAVAINADWPNRGQLRHLNLWGQPHSLVILLRADADANPDHLEVLRKYHIGSVVIARLPSGSRIATMERAAIREHIEVAAREQGVAIRQGQACAEALA